MPADRRLALLTFVPLPVAVVGSGEPRELDWAEFIPASERAGYNPAPPPPPPNQIVFVVIEAGLNLDSMYAACWVTGTMTTRSRDTRLGKSAYTLDTEAVEEYEF